MTEINIASLRARLLDAALCDGLSLDDAEKRARQAMAWVERGDAPLMIEGPKKAASTPPSSPLPKPKTVVVDLQIALVGKTDASKPPQSGADPISERDKTIRKEYAKHTPIGQIAKILGCSPPTIYHALKRMGIPLHGATNASRAWSTSTRRCRCPHKSRTIFAAGLTEMRRAYAGCTAPTFQSPTLPND